MEQNEFKKTLVSLYADYTKAVAKRSKELEKEDERLAINPTFEGFMQWLDNGEAELAL